MPLVVGQMYTRVEVQQTIGVPNPTHQGKWGTGYTQHGGEFYIFANIGGAGRTGHDYPNEWDGDVFNWCGKPKTTASQPQMRALLEPGTRSHIFTRHGDRDRFIYYGVGIPTAPRGEHPLMVTWVFDAKQAAQGNAPVPGAQPRVGPLHGEYRRATAPKKSEDKVIQQGVLNRNPALLERALRGHADTQNALADHLSRLGVTASSPRGAVDYDIAWQEGQGISVAEVKSITDANEVSQLRTGVGQLLDYAAELEHHGERVERILLVLEREPRSPAHWRRVCRRAGIVLTWAPQFERV